jgi:hypothetical protein
MIVLPTIHLNGTSPAALEEKYRFVRQAINAAAAALAAATFKPRDFYPQGPDAWQRARDDRAEAFRMLRLLSDYAEQWESRAANHRHPATHHDHHTPHRALSGHPAGAGGICGHPQR